MSIDKPIPDFGICIWREFSKSILKIGLKTTEDSMGMREHRSFRPGHFSCGFLKLFEPKGNQLDRCPFVVREFQIAQIPVEADKCGYLMAILQTSLYEQIKKWEAVDARNKIYKLIICWVDDHLVFTSRMSIKAESCLFSLGFRFRSESATCSSQLFLRWGLERTARTIFRSCQTSSYWSVDMLEDISYLIHT